MVYWNHIYEEFKQILQLRRGQKRDGKMLRIVIFDDEPRIGLQLKQLLEQSGAALTADYFQDWHALQFYFSQHAHIDAVFMDICFHGSTKTGIDFAEKLAQTYSQTKFIYVTGHPLDYAEQIFMSSTVQPYGFLSKPFQKEKVLYYVGKLQGESTSSQNLLTFKPVGSQAVYLSLPDVLYFSSDRRCVTAYTAADSYTGYYRLAELAEQLPDYFYLCHKSFLVNLHHIQRIENKNLFIQDAMIPISAIGHRSVADNRQDLIRRKSELHT